MKRLIQALDAIAALALVGMFASAFIAIWHPWGHVEEWKQTAVFLLFIAATAAAAAVFVKDSGGKR